jgi:Fe-S-cluster containining protein
MADRYGGEVMPLRIAVIGSSPCHACAALCCKQNGHDYAVLLEGEAERRRFAAFSTAVVVSGDRAPVEERVLPYVDGRCRFLGDDDRCTIYDDRPANCRRFECVRSFRTGPGGSHGVFLRRNPAALRAIESW